jgi:hypothetical protein
VRFEPPPLETPEALRWVLVRALGSPDTPATPPSDGVLALSLARGAALAALVGSRHSLKTLAGEVGPRAAAGFVLEHESAWRAEEALLQALPLLAESASAAGTPVVLLKFAALKVAGHAAPGTRTAGDVDALVSPESAPAVASGLAALGFEETGFRDGHHQLPMLRDGQGRKVEIHRYIPGVRVAGTGARAAVRALQDSDGLRSVARVGPEGMESWNVPTRALLLAHAIVHGIAQHGFTPQVYPLFRMMADLVMLRGSEEDLASVHRWIAGEVSETETRAALVLAERLARADQALFEPAAHPPPETVLLRHLTATLVDQDYARSLRLGWPGHSLGQPGLMERARSAWKAIALTDVQIDAIYGPPRARWGYLGRRLARPFDLVWRTARYGLSRLRVRFRNRRSRA